MAAETIGFAIQPEDRAELDRLVAIYGDGNRSAFLREAIRIMAARERAERFARIQTSFRQAMIDKHGRELTADELTALSQRVVKGK